MKNNSSVKQIYSGIGGQAVIEGIMMKNNSQYAVGVRKPDGEIVVTEDVYHSFADRHPVCKLPFIRGVFSFLDSMILGMQTLTYSASFYEDDENETPSGFELWLKKVFGEKLETVLESVIVIISCIFAVLIFVLFPACLASLVRKFVSSEFLLSLFEGVIRVLIFVIYIRLISRTPDIARTFQYHGAEHKCINCVEHGLDLTVENVRASSKEHKRCGTSFIVYVMLISILLFMVIRFDDIWLKMISRIVLIPVIAGISYEVLRLVGKKENRLTALLFIPGRWMQGLTTSEPDDSQIEVAIAAVEKVFDWKKFKQENFGQDTERTSE